MSTKKRKQPTRSARNLKAKGLTVRKAKAVKGGSTQLAVQLPREGDHLSDEGIGSQFELQPLTTEYGATRKPWP
jgi:hypothetical protein